MEEVQRAARRAREGATLADLCRELGLQPADVQSLLRLAVDEGGLSRDDARAIIQADRGFVDFLDDAAWRPYVRAARRAPPASSTRAEKPANVSTRHVARHKVDTSIDTSGESPASPGRESGPGAVDTSSTRPPTRRATKGSPSRRSTYDTPGNMGETRARVLQAVKDLEPDASPDDVARKLGLQGSTARSALIDLREAGVLRSAKAGKRALYFLTPKGAEVLRHVEPRHVDGDTQRPASTRPRAAPRKGGEVRAHHLQASSEITRVVHPDPAVERRVLVEILGFREDRTRAEAMNWPKLFLRDEPSLLVEVRRDSVVWTLRKGHEIYSPDPDRATIIFAEMVDASRRRLEEACREQLSKLLGDGGHASLRIGRPDRLFKITRSEYAFEGDPGAERLVEARVYLDERGRWKIDASEGPEFETYGERAQDDAARYARVTGSIPKENYRALVNGILDGHTRVEDVRELPGLAETAAATRVLIAHVAQDLVERRKLGDAEVDRIADRVAEKLRRPRPAPADSPEVG